METETRWSEFPDERKKEIQKSRIVLVTVRDPSREVTHLSMVIWNRKTMFELAICNLQFARHFGSLQMSFCIVSKTCELLKSNLLIELLIELAI